ARAHVNAGAMARREPWSTDRWQRERGAGAASRWRYDFQRHQVLKGGTIMKRASIAAMIIAVSTPWALHAESGNVEIYGTINVDAEAVQATGASPASVHPANQLGATPTGIDVPHRDRVTSNSSNIGFRGAQPLGGGL